MTRIDELQKKYPSIPPEVILKWEVLRNGVRDTEGLDKASTWQKAGAHYSYQSYDHDISLKELIEKRPARFKPGYILRPPILYTENGLGAEIHINTVSPYEIREIGESKFGLFEGDAKVDHDIFFLSSKVQAGEEAVTSKGKPVSSFVSVRHRICFGISPVRYCEYFAHGVQCKFCNFNGTQDDASSIGLGRPVSINLEETLEAYKIVSSSGMLVEGRVEFGGFQNRETEAKAYLSFIEAMSNATSYKPNFTIKPQPIDRKAMQRLKDVGADCCGTNMEVWDPRMFAEVCPGKAKNAGREGYIEAYQAAVDVFGIGQVGTNFVGGVGLVPSNGFSTWQEARDSHIEGSRWMIRNGVHPLFTPLRLPPGSVYGTASHREKTPPTEFYLDVALAQHEAMLEYGLYEKVNKFLYCAFDCAAAGYAGEIGWLKIAGDVGNWMASVVPDEANWLAKFISSMKSGAEA